MILFVLADSPFKMVFLIIFVLLSFSPFFHILRFSHWVSYVIFIVYLGGLLILFLYFTSAINFFKKEAWTVLLVFLVFVLLFFKKTPTIIFSLNRVFFLSTEKNNIILIFIFVLFLLVLFFVTKMVFVSRPIRQ